MIQTTPYRSRDHPEERNVHFYSIHARNDGSVNVYLTPSPGVILPVYGIRPWEGMEEDIRARYDAWCKSAEIEITYTERGITMRKVMEMQGPDFVAELEDEVYIRDPEGEFVKQEVPDDAEDD